MYGDVPLLEAGLLEALLDAHRAAASRALARERRRRIDPGLLGRVVRDEAGEVERIVEARDATEDELEIDEINAGIYAFDAAWLRRADRRPAPLAGHRRAVPDRARRARPGRRAADRDASRSATTGRCSGSTTGRSSPTPTYRLRERINERHLLAGVTMLDPSTA